MVQHHIQTTNLNLRGLPRVFVIRKEIKTSGSILDEILIRTTYLDILNQGGIFFQIYFQEWPNPFLRKHFKPENKLISLSNLIEFLFQPDELVFKLKRTFFFF